MTDDLVATRDEIMLATLTHVPFDGWTRRALEAGVAEAGLTPDMAFSAFPGGVPDLVDHLNDWADRRMLEALGKLNLDSMRVRDRVAAGVRTRLEILAGHREALRRSLSYLAMPRNAPLAVRWYAAGDEAWDFNYYTKRGLLAPVYATTVLYWLADTSAGTADTWAYLDRRIADVMKIPAFKSRIKKAFSSLPRPSGLFRRARG
jgi:ubiquinone biosynthesis protein COQ9